MAVELARRGNHVTAVSPLFDGVHRFPAPAETSFRDGRLKLVHVPEARNTRFGASGHGLRRALEPLLPGADVLHLHAFLSPWADLACTLARRAGVPYVIQDHGKLTPSMVNNRRLAKTAYLKLRGLSLLRDAAFVVPSAPNLARAVERLDPRIRCEVCSNGFDPADFEGAPAEPPIEPPYVLYLGWLDPRKNLDLLLRAFAALGRLSRTWRLALVGPDAYGQQSSLRPLIDELGIADRVVMPGMKKGREKLAWLRHAGLFVLPSAGEGLSAAMIEALACGLPCLLSPGCNFPEIEDFGAGEVVETSPERWAEAMGKWLGDAPARAEAGRNARRLFQERHTLSVTGARMEHILRRAAMRRRVAVRA
jgi:glycosyltransferase involved in cell wall biosynthesis